ncbi:CAP domain-containing protein [Paracoccus sp. PARArs4]|uniref:CAP domain-containing protein n=1 Tax=Paracoccus sp. PARArs4 TaxID=2853442 RepID=UPI0024A655E2|nr:CAP domain-containing protein [Paracoccus sp. PARArs4]
MSDRNRWLAGTLLGGVLMIAACAPEPGDGPATDPYAVQVAEAGDAECIAASSEANRIGVAATNRARARQGLPPMQPDPVLAEVAARHACDMAERGRMTHFGSRARMPSDRAKRMNYQPMIIAENIAAGPYDLQRVLLEWNRSEGHLENIMQPLVRDYGIGQAIGADGRTRYWSAVYAARK